MRDKSDYRSKSIVSDVLSCITLAVFVIVGAIYYASCYYNTNNLAFTKEDSFIFTIIIVAVLALAVTTIILSFIIIGMRKEIRDLMIMEVDNHAELTKQNDETVRYIIKNGKDINKINGVL
jgi:ABC-type lipoprotein release transport system permease subunit